jgi:dipeptidyl aminopeptidase/acylaminoacyl peptidase
MSTADNLPPIQMPYGAWKSPVTAEALADSQVRFENLRSVDGQLYWTENVPAAGGAHGVFRLGASGAAITVVAAVHNVRGRVHEYGAAPYVVIGATAYYTRFADQRLYRLAPGAEPEPLTPPGYRYADCVPLRTGAGPVTALIGVREDHTDPQDVRNAVVRIDLAAGGAGEVLYADSDFVAYPRVSPDGRRVAFIAWRHPNMPWDATTLSVADLGVRGLMALTSVAGAAAESVLEPQWDADGTLYFISDRSGFWNLYGWDGAAVRAVWPRAAEFASPLWQLGQANYALLGQARALARFGEGGIDRLAVIDLRRGSARMLELPYVQYDQMTRIDDEHVAMVAGSARGPQSIVRINVSSGQAETLREAGRALLSPAAVSVAVPIDYPSTQGRTAHAFYYPPVNPAFCGSAAELPPLLTLVHGGPTTQATPAYSPAVQYWTSRGFAVVDVNYGGSSGFGRAYRRQLEGNWGVVDVADVIAAAQYLSRTGRVDPLRTAIRGGSAGGYTVLLALCTSDVFRAGADYYGVSDMAALARDTHKFESRYLDSLIGPLPQAQPIYESRSPLQHLAGFKVPLLVLQGADDPVVPPNQSALIVDALRARGAPVAYLLFAGEGHGFRKPENIIRSLQAELSFYGQVFGFTPADPLPALVIENLAPAAAPAR